METKLAYIKNLKDQTLTKDRAIAVCPCCGAEYSANKGDYWNLNENDALTLGSFNNYLRSYKMCTCHKYDRDSRKFIRALGTFSLKSGNTGDVFRFPHETFYRKIHSIDFRNAECYAPPIENYSGMDEKSDHVFHLSFKAIFGEKQNG